MDNLEQQLSALMGNPQMMQQLMQMAQSFQASTSPTLPPSGEGTPPKPSPLPELDLGMLQKLSGMTGRIDSHQQALLKALGPYLSNDRIGKLEKAMRATQMARIASAALSQKG